MFNPLTIKTIIEDGFNMCKEYDVNLETLVPFIDDVEGAEGQGTQKFWISGNELVITTEGDADCLRTADSYTLPIRVDLTAKTDGNDIRIIYNNGQIIYNLGDAPEYFILTDILIGEQCSFIKDKISPGEYVEITWWIEETCMEVYVNGEKRHAYENLPYHGLLKIEPGRTVTSPVRISAANGSTVTVKSLKVTEL
jgi:hypothetical protein